MIRLRIHFHDWGKNRKSVFPMIFKLFLHMRGDKLRGKVYKSWRKCFYGLGTTIKANLRCEKSIHALNWINRTVSAVWAGWWLWSIFSVTAWLFKYDISFNYLWQIRPTVVLMLLLPPPQQVSVLHYYKEFNSYSERLNTFCKINADVGSYLSTNSQSPQSREPEYLVSNSADTVNSLSK